MADLWHPCEHAYGVIIDKKHVPKNYVCHWFIKTTWRRNYTDGVCPQRGPKFWPETNDLDVYVPEPPEPGEKKMRKVEKERQKGVNESPTKKAPKNKKRIMHCGIYGITDS